MTLLRDQAAGSRYIGIHRPTYRDPEAAAGRLFRPPGRDSRTVWARFDGAPQPATPNRRSGELHEGEGAVAAGRDEEVLPPRGGEEPLQPVVVGVHAELRHQIQRRLVDP